MKHKVSIFLTISAILLGPLSDCVWAAPELLQVRPKPTNKQLVELKDYAKCLRAYLLHKWKGEKDCPMTTRLILEISAKGTTSNIHLDRSSGTAECDDACIAAAQSLPPLPKGINGVKVRFDFAELREIFKNKN
jgi:TonB family protein